MTKEKERLKERKREMMRKDEVGKLGILFRAVDTGGGRGQRVQAPPNPSPPPPHHFLEQKKIFFLGKIRVDEREGVGEKSDKK